MKFESQDILGGDILENDSRLKRAADSIAEKRSFYQAKPEEFKELPGYLEETINRELKYVQDLEEQWAGDNTEFEKRQKTISDILEGILVDQFSSDWLAGKGEGFFTSKPDDYIRGVDAVVEFKDQETDEKNHVGFALDIAYSSSYGTLEHKLTSIWKDVKAGKLAEVKYFEDSDENKMSLKLSRVLVSIERDTVRELIELYARKRKDDLAVHKFQYSLILQIKMQLEAQYVYVAAYGEEGSNQKFGLAKKQIAEALGCINEIFTIKSAEIEKHRAQIEESPGFRQIKDFYEEKAHDPRTLAA